MLDDDLVLGLDVALAAELLESVLRTDVERKFCKERHREVAEVCLVLDACVKHLSEEEECERDSAAKDKGCEDDHLFVRAHRSRGTARADDQTGVSYVHQGCELVVFTLLEKEGVEVLGDLLLTLERKELEFLS